MSTILVATQSAVFAIDTDHGTSTPAPSVDHGELGRSRCGVGRYGAERSTAFGFSTSGQVTFASRGNRTAIPLTAKGDRQDQD